MAAVEILTREFGMANLVTPTGRKFGVKQSSVHPGLVVIDYIDGLGGDLPDKLKGAWTKRDWAEVAIRNHLKLFWDKSDAAAKK